MKQPTVKDAIYQAIVDLVNSNQPATREAVSDLTGLKQAVVDDHVKTLRDDGMIRRVVPGVFTPVQYFPPPRDVSKTVLTNGMVKMEMGDVLVELTPAEARIWGKSLHGDAMELAHETGDRETRDLIAQLEAKTKAMEKEARENKARMDYLVGVLAKVKRQDDLFTA